MVGLSGLEPPTSRLSGVRSNQLSYRPIIKMNVNKHSKLNTICHVIPFHLRRRCSEYILRKEVIQPHLPIRLPCYDFTPVTNPTVVSALLAVKLPTSGKTRSHGVTGGVYKTRERIHRDMLIRDY